MPCSLRAIGLVQNLNDPPIDHKVNSMILKSDRATIAMAIGLTIGAIRATFLTRSWIILAIGLLADKLACSTIGLHRHAVAQRWSAEITRQIPEKLQEFFDKAWIGPLGLAAPFFNLSEATTANDIIRSLLGILFTLTIWGLVGSAICRIALTRMADAPIPGVKSALKYAIQQKKTLAGSILAPIALIMILFSSIIILGVMTKLPFAGPVFAWVFVPLALIPSCILVFTLIGCILGWPLAMAAAMAEGEDLFDAFSRSQTYLFQAPLSFAITFKVGFLLQAIGYAMVQFLSWGLIFILHSGFAITGFVTDPVNISWSKKLPAPWTMPDFSTSAFNSWVSLITHLAASWPIGFAFAFPAALYLTLRTKVDHVPPTEIDWPGKPEGDFAGQTAPHESASVSE